jgi:hypothetical protein
MLDQATLDDLLVSGADGGVYDVNLVMRLVRVFVSSEDDAHARSQRMRKVGRLIDKYLGEISPDQGLKVSKFLAVAESLPGSARDCYDGVYRALDVYLEVNNSPNSKLLFQMLRSDMSSICSFLQLKEEEANFRPIGGFDSTLTVGNHDYPMITESCYYSVANHSP